MNAQKLVDEGVCISNAQARRLISSAPESKINEMIKKKRLENLTGFTRVTEIKFQTFFKRKNFTPNKIRNSTQFIVDDKIIGVAIFDNAVPKNSKFYLKKDML